jgi:hypothetical protein
MSVAGGGSDEPPLPASRFDRRDFGEFVRKLVRRKILNHHFD